MADYNPEAYVMLAEIGCVEVSKTTLRVGVFRYAEGEPKIKVQKVVTRKGKVEEVPLKGFGADEAEAVAPLLVQGAAKLREIVAGLAK